MVENTTSESLSSHKKVAIIGSSGGGTATLGHTNPPELLRTIDEHLRRLNASVGHALFVSLNDGGGMDGVDEKTALASLFQVDSLSNHDQNSSSNDDDNNNDNNNSSAATPVSTFDCQMIQMGTLESINKVCQTRQEHIARDIEIGRIHGLILISCHVGIFRSTLQQGAQSRIPVTGSGGTSLSQAVARYGLSLVGNAGGSVASSTITRAVSYTHALAVAWQRPYQPWRAVPGTHVKSTTTPVVPSFRSVLNACLPVFWAVCLVRFVLTRPWMPPAPPLLQTALTDHILPTACAVIMATSLTEASSSNQGAVVPTASLIMASVLASAACSQTIVGGLLAGWMVASVSDRVLYYCIFQNVPTTMANLVTSGGTGAAVALGLSAVAPVLRQASTGLRWILVQSIQLGDDWWLRAGAGLVWGCASCYGSKVGWYHAVFLPLILVEMERGNPSFVGAVDELTLVLVCAGICSGRLVVHSRMMTSTLQQQQQQQHEGDVALCRRGLRINLCYGDFIEVCYPLMERHPIINVGGYLASGLSTAWLVSSNAVAERLPQSMAYLPLPVSILLAGEDWQRMLGASVIAFGVSFLATLMHFALYPPKSHVS